MTAKPMTKRAQIHRLWLKGKSNAEIAQAMAVSPGYVATTLWHVRRMAQAGKALQTRPGRPSKREGGA